MVLVRGGQRKEGDAPAARVPWPSASSFPCWQQPIFKLPCSFAMNLQESPHPQTHASIQAGFPQDCGSIAEQSLQSTAVYPSIHSPPSPPPHGVSLPNTKILEDKGQDLVRPHLPREPTKLLPCLSQLLGSQSQVHSPILAKTSQGLQAFGQAEPVTGLRGAGGACQGVTTPGRGKEERLARVSLWVDENTHKGNYLIRQGVSRQLVDNGPDLEMIPIALSMEQKTLHAEGCQDLQQLQKVGKSLLLPRIMQLLPIRADNTEQDEPMPLPRTRQIGVQS